MRSSPLIILSVLIALAAAPLAARAALVDINTAGAALLETLPGIGPAKASAIIDYRDRNGPFAAVADIQNVSGIGPATFANIEPLITVGGTGSPAPAAATVAEAATTTAAAPPRAGAPYVPPPSSLAVDAGPDRSAVVEAPLRLSARVTAKGGAPDSAARILWSFGDGSSSEGSAVEKVYRYPGTYLAAVTATDGAATARAEIVITAAPAQVRISAVSSEGITLANDASERLDLSGWRLSTSGGFFRLPEGTALLPGASVLFPYDITNVPRAFEAALFYPDGVVAARYAPPREPFAQDDIAQPPAPGTGSSLVQTVEPALTSISGTAHEKEAVGAPAAATELAAAGAALPAASSAPPAGAPAPASRLSRLLRSPWTYGLVGIITLAGGAFIFL